MVGLWGTALKTLRVVACWSMGVYRGLFYVPMSSLRVFDSRRAVLETVPLLALTSMKSWKKDPLEVNRTLTRCRVPAVTGFDFCSA